MVKLTKIYTRSGDDGTTGLGSGARVLKTSVRVEAYGSVDEANAFLGVAIVACEQQAAQGGADDVLGSIVSTLKRCQNDLFDVGADLCTPIEKDEQAGARLRVIAPQTKALERDIDTLNARLGALTSFVLPGGSTGAAALHVARAQARRAERGIVALLQVEADATNPETVRYVNRLSDLLFVMARVANSDGADDVLWEPGQSQGQGKSPGAND